MSIATNTPHAVFFVGIDNGFQITCPADTSLRTLKLYVGTDGARGRFTANLLRSGLPGITNTAYANPSTGSNGLFIVDFQAASAGHTLVVTFTLETNLTSGASVILQAATLTSASLPPLVTIISPPQGAVFIAPADISLSASATNGAGSVTNLEIHYGSNLVGRSESNSLTATLSNQFAGIYRFTASATDNRGLSVTSPPVTLYVTTGGGTLLGNTAIPPAILDLTAEGALDWAHQGLLTRDSFDHKANVLQPIPNVVLVAVTSTNVNRYTDNFTAYTWTDGTPNATVSATPTGIFSYGLSNGFELSVPATMTLRRVNVYVGLYGAQGKLEAALSDESGPPFSDTSIASAYNNAYGVYTLTFASRLSSANLVIRWTADALFDESYGNVTWQAATLVSIPGGGANASQLKIVYPVQAGSLTFSFSTQENRSYTVEFSESLPSQNWQVLTNFQGNGNELQLTCPSLGKAQRFYRVKTE